MSKNKGFSETSANRYSLALYELAKEANMLSEIEVHSVSIIDLIASSTTSRSLEVGIEDRSKLKSVRFYSELA